MGQTFKFKSKADRDTFNDGLTQIVALTNSKGGKSFVYNMDTAPTELTMVFIWESTSSFQLTEKLFGETESITVRAHSICGSVPAVGGRRQLSIARGSFSVFAG